MPLIDKRKWLKALKFLSLTAIALLSSCQQPLAATPFPTQEIVRISLPTELNPLRQAIQVCSQAQPEMALFEETGKSPADLQFVLGEPPGLESFAAQIAREQIQVVVNPQNPIQSLTQADLIDLMSGRKINWKEFNGDDIQVMVWTYPAGESMRNLFDRLVINGMHPSGNTFLAPSPEAMREAVAQDPSAVGFLPAAWVDESVKPVELDPALDQALLQPILALSDGTPQGSARKLLACLQSGAGRDEIEQSYPLAGPRE